jgi:hypothetical protein
MDPTTIASVFKLLGDVAKALPVNSPARQQIDLLKEQINLLKRQITSLKNEKTDLKTKVADLTKELADLQERFAANQLSTVEYQENGYIWRQNSQGKLGPYCPSHRDICLVDVGDMGMYCSKCRVPINPS